MYLLQIRSKQRNSVSFNGKNNPPVSILHSFFIKRKVKVKLLSCVRLFVDPMKPTRLLHPWDFSRQEYRSGLPFPSPGDLPDPGIEPQIPILQADALPSEPPGKPNPSQILTESILLCCYVYFRFSLIK